MSTPNPPAVSAPEGDTADVIERAARALFDSDRAEGTVTPFDLDWDEHTRDGKARQRYYARAEALAAAGLLAASPAPDSLGLDALAGVCRVYVSAWDDQHADATILGSLARRVALAVSPAAPQAAKALILEIAEEYLYDGDTDQPLPGYRELIDAVGGYDNGPSAPAPAGDEAASKHPAEMVTIPKSHLDRMKADLDRWQPRADDEAAQHVIEFRENGWTIMHPLSCRPALFDCPVNRAAEDQLDQQPDVLGRFVVELQDGELVVGEPADESTLAALATLKEGQR